MAESVQKLAPMNLKELSGHGIKHFAELPYRFEAAKRLSVSTGADHAIFFDDLAYAVPVAQRTKLAGLPGYERVLLPALLMAPGFENGVSVICAAPPNPVEMANFKRLKTMMDEKGSVQSSVRVLHENDGKLVDLMQMDPDEYDKVSAEFAKRMGNPSDASAFTPEYHTDVFKRHAGELLSVGKKAYVAPFQSTPDHYNALHDFVEADQVALPDLPNMDKAHNNFLLRKEGLGKYLHTMHAIHADGTIVADYDTYIQKSEITSDRNPDVFARNEQNIQTMAEGVLNSIDILAGQNMKAIAKLDSNGVSGLGNLMPGRHPEIYDTTLDRPARLRLLVDQMRKSYADSETLPQFAVVEEFIDDAKRVDGFKHDLTVGGMMIDGEFMPMSIFPFATNDDGEYDRGWIASDAALVQENPEQWQELFKAYAEMGEVMSRYGYRNGVLAGDVMVRENGQFVFHDYNFRRGGRSTPEALIAIEDNVGLFEVQLKIDHSTGLPDVKSNEELFEYYTQTCARLSGDFGITPFSTSFGYFGYGDGSHPFMKLKLLVPMELLQDQPRTAHSEVVQKLVTSFFN